MNVVQLTPGAGAMYCGNCLRDNSLVTALRALGHPALMVPLYLPLTLDEPDQSADTPIFFGGISVFLEQKARWFRHAPSWLHHLLAARPLLRWAAGKAARTRPEQAGELTLSMLQGEHGHQARELAALIDWLKTQPQPDIVCLSNALLLGSARRLKRDLDATLVCMLQGEDSFLDGLPASHRSACWDALKERTADVDGFIAPSRYYADVMVRRLGLPPSRVTVVHNGINLDGYGEPATAPDQATAPPVLGYFARMCPEKGLDTVVDAFILIRDRGKIPGLRLRVGGSCGPGDLPFVNQLRRRLEQAMLHEHVEFHPNLDRSRKVAFLRSLTVFSVPARYGEAFGLYVLEALAAGVPVVQPRAAAFPELIAASGGGLLSEPGNAESLAQRVEELLLNPRGARLLGETGRRSVFEKFSAEAMARAMLEVWRQAPNSRQAPGL
ncbi:MAG TPA: glycosyltransferase family 4 protein [Verrucomicrobiae bacterium]